MKWIRRILLGALALLLMMIVGAGALVAYEVSAGAQVSDFTNVSYTAEDGTEILAYLAQPEGEGPFPALLMVHEWWGLNGEITEMADMMAEEGYVVLAPDTYRGQTTALVPRALVLRLGTPEAQIDADMAASFAYLSGLDNVDAARIGALGFCYGGGVALAHAVQNPQIRATINLYGERIEDPQAFGALLLPDAGPVLGIFGEDDAQIPVIEVEAFEAAMNDAGITNTVTIYSGVGHAFVNPSSVAAGGAAEEAWQQMLAFLEAQLKAEQPEAEEAPA